MCKHLGRQMKRYENYKMTFRALRKLLQSCVMRGYRAAGGATRLGGRDGGIEIRPGRPTTGCFVVHCAEGGATNRGRGAGTLCGDCGQLAMHRRAVTEFVGAAEVPPRFCNRRKSVLHRDCFRYSTVGWLGGCSMPLCSGGRGGDAFRNPKARCAPHQSHVPSVNLTVQGDELKSVSAFHKIMRLALMRTCLPQGSLTNKNTKAAKSTDHSAHPSCSLAAGTWNVSLLGSMVETATTANLQGMVVV